MYLENVTVQDCIEMMRFKGLYVVLSDGKVVEFKQEKQPHTIVIWCGA